MYAMHHALLACVIVIVVFVVVEVDLSSATVVRDSAKQLQVLLLFFLPQAVKILGVKN